MKAFRRVHCFTSRGEWGSLASAVLLISESLLVLPERLVNPTGGSQRLAMGFVATTATLQTIWLQDGPGGPAGGVCQLSLGVILDLSIDIFILSSLYL